MEPGASESVTEQLQMEMIVKTEVDAVATSNPHIDIKTDLNHLKQESRLVQYLESEPALLVKEEILEDSSQDGNGQQCVQGASTSASTSRWNEACSTSLSDLLKVKDELVEMDVGPTVLQHMDIYYTINKTAVTKQNSIVDDCNEAVPCSGVKKESVEDKLRVDKTIPCKFCGQNVTEDDNDKTHIKFCQGQQKDLQQHQLHQLRTTRSIGFKCERTITKPHLLSVHNKLHQRNCKNIFMMTRSSKQRRDETAITKKKPDVCAKEYSSEGAKFAQSDGLTKQTIRKNHSIKRVHTGKAPHQCDTCGKRFAQNSKLIQHIRVHTGEKPYQCDTCDLRFSQKCNLVQHMRVHTSEKRYRCDTCDKRFGLNSTLVLHMRVHTGEKPYKCDTCDARFTRKNSLTPHMRVHTSEKPYRCDTCEARFARKDSLLKHMRVHTSDKPYRCDTCDARFARKTYLVRHMRVHTREKPYRCDTCDKRFGLSSNLSKHMIIHTGLKRYQCDTCDAKFARKDILVQHMVVHMKEKPYRCDTCDKIFSQNSQLVHHMRVHTGEKSFQCDTCDARFARKWHLIKHRKVHTG